MDETKETQANSPQGTEKASAGSEGTTPTVQAKTYTQSEMDKAIQADRISRGRDAKAFEVREKSLTEREERIKAEEAKIEAAEVERLKDNPEALDLHKQRKAIKEERAALERDKAEHSATIKAAQDSVREKAIWGIAAEHREDPKEMADLFNRLNGLGIDDMEKLGQIADAIAPKKAEESAEEQDEGKAPFNPDSNVTSGSGKQYTGVSFEKNAPSAKDMISKGLKKK